MATTYTTVLALAKPAVDDVGWGAAIDGNFDTIDLLALLLGAVQTDNYTLVLGDLGDVVEMNKATAVNLTVPPNASVAFPIGTVIEIFQLGAGQVTIVPGSGVTIRSPSGKLKLTGQYSSASLRKRATNEWVAAGDLSA